MKEYFNISSGNWQFHLLIGILLFLIFKWIIGKFVKKKKLKAFYSLISAIIFTPIVFNVSIIIFFSILFYEYHPETKFDSIKWKVNANDRHEMRKDLINSKVLIDKTKNKVISILGIPENNINVSIDTVINWTYYLGSIGHGMGSKFHYLSLDFKNNKVVAAENNFFID